jgi:hypothetical protein
MARMENSNYDTMVQHLAGEIIESAIVEKEARETQQEEEKVASTQSRLMSGRDLAAMRIKQAASQGEEDEVEKQASMEKTAAINEAIDVYNEAQMLKQAAEDALMEAKMNEDAALEVLAQLGYLDDEEE